MHGLTLSEPNRFAILWRRKWIVIITTVLVAAVTLAVSKSLTPVYSTTATLIVAQPGATQTFDTAQATEEAARSFAQVLGGTDFARQVAQSLGAGATGATVSSQTSITSVTGTELITITAENSKPLLAQRIANTYANVFLGFAPRLTPQTKATVSLANSATVPTAPVRPKPTLYALAAAVLGIAAGIALAFMRERFDVRVRSVEEIATVTDLPVLASVPVRGARTIPAFTEAFRLLRTTLRFLDHGEELRRFAVTSWSESEGKTTISYQLAMVIGMAGGRNVLIDGDTHRAGLCELVDSTKDPHGRPGFTDFVLGAVPLENSLYRTPLPDVGFMPPGRSVASLSNLLESSGGSDALDRLGHTVDTVVVDCPPLAASADASSLATKVDGVILVVDLRKATTVSIRRAIGQLQAVNARIVGLVVNRDPNADSLDYYRYGADQSGNGAAPSSPMTRLRSRLVLRPWRHRDPAQLPAPEARLPARQGPDRGADPGPIQGAGQGPVKGSDQGSAKGPGQRPPGKRRAKRPASRPSRRT